MSSVRDTTDGYLWPLPTLDSLDGPGTPGRKPEISQDFNGAGHPGVDIMYRRITADPADTPGNKTWVVPTGTAVLATRGGTVVVAALWTRGHAVQLAHLSDPGGTPLYSNYLHLATLAVSAGDLVDAGDVLGTVGADPLDPEGLPHLHFEIRTVGAREPLDPAGFLAGAAPSSPRGGPLLLLLLALLAASLHRGG